MKKLRLSGGFLYDLMKIISLQTSLRAGTLLQLLKRLRMHTRTRDCFGPQLIVVSIIIIIIHFAAEKQM